MANKSEKGFKESHHWEGVDLGDDDVKKSELEGAVFARNMVKDLSKHVRFCD